MTIINRDKIIAEELIRSYVRKRISYKLQLKINEERIIRRVVHNILEAEAGTTEPSSYTGINVLANLLEKIIPVIESDYKMLTTSAEQRESFRNHIIHAIKNSLKPIEVATDAEKIGENTWFDVKPDQLMEDLKIDLDTQTDKDSTSEEFIDISSDDEDDEFVQIDDQNETGRNFAATTYKNVEKQIVDAYDMLADEEDQKLFYDYLLTNVMLYFDKFEDELQNSLPDVTTAEYEEEKEEPNVQDDDEDSEPTEDLFNS